ncbi:hypothetical protein [Streptomyces jeddahensis]|uniref:Glycosyltransferase RgtA/B/C/D-like domain-containing protein n=1 Tax=Streptomyces jeddahensis TaxID=1716141 RepID=A0A177HEC7_9ACTN|nr:hypothetical protein [Streptomyces jeddahensis]OAH09305.1 hypothetical protein STSP_73890 [Streptomyces jeddahensis]
MKTEHVRTSHPTQAGGNATAGPATSVPVDRVQPTGRTTTITAPAGRSGRAADPTGQAGGPRRQRFPPALRRRPAPWLALVALAYATVQLAAVVPHIGHVLGWDETVYVSQVDPRTPAAYFSAPRSRGISMLVAPVLAVTSDPFVLRIVLALLSAAALYAAFRVWRPLVGRGTTALAALLFAGLWTTILYGPQAMPNLWVALGAVATAGWFLRTGRGARRSAPWWMAACLAATALLRLPDAGWLALPLIGTAALIRERRRALPWLLGGLAAGGAQWVVEAYRRFGGIPQRLRVSGATEGGMSPHLNLGNAWRALNGPDLCRPCTVPLRHPELTVWWLALPLLTAAALVLAFADHRRGRVGADARTPAGTARPFAVTAVPVACAASLAVPYLLLLGYFAPRFLLPTYALLALPIAALLIRAARARALLAAAVALAVAGQLGSQYAVLERLTAEAAAVDHRYQTAADDLHALGLRAPCLVTGPRALPVAYDAGCASAETSGNNRSVTTRELLHRAGRQPTVALTAGGRRPPRYALGWTAHVLPGTGGWTAWRAPSQR